MPGAHALLSASGAKRWISCPPSARLENEFTEDPSPYAAEGTLAHEVGELKLRYLIGEITQKQFAQRHAELMSCEYGGPAMDDYTDEYCAFVGERLSTLQAEGKSPTLYIEQRLDFSSWVPQGFGTGDAVIAADGEIAVIDLKYGKGVPVDAHENPQLRLYALGALESLGFLYEDITRVTTVVYQPRLDSVTEETLSVKELEAWAAETVALAAKLAFEGKGEFQAGDHCRFCRARATCRARADANLAPAQEEFADPALLTNEEIAGILQKVAELKAWADDVSSYALDQAANHKAHFPGWKLVEGRSNRTYIDEMSVAERLRKAGYASEAIYKPAEVYGITEMEKRLGKKTFAALLGELVRKPTGKPVLVPRPDKRAEINSLETARQEFAAPIET